MPVWAYTLASHIDREPYKLDLYDTRIESIDNVRHADIYLFTGINQDYPTLVEAHKTLKDKFPNSKFILGGPITWSYSQAGDLDKFSFFDHLFIGDGEGEINDLLNRIIAGDEDRNIIRNEKRFEISNSVLMDRSFLEKTVHNYYGAVIEVSRGCPFLCEFCDIRVLPDNNRPHNKPTDIIVQEVELLYSLGARTFLLACDNFIGEPRWAEELVDKLLELSERTGITPVFYTWLTINLHKMPRLMEKMRRAGFDIVFIGLESFNSSSLLETAKVQNKSAGVAEATQSIQSYGFSVVAGLIFGFDSDDETCFNIALKGILEAGLLSGDPSLLTALPGTPLYTRMKLANRIRKVRYGLGGFKYHTNILYLQPRKEMIRRFLEFVDVLVDGEYQYQRLKSYFEILNRGNYIPISGRGYFNLGQAIRMIMRDPQAMKLAAQRVILFVSKPRNLYYLAKGAWFVYSQRNIKNRFSYLKFWMALWSTIIVKYQNISVSDFDIESVPEGFDIHQLIPDGYEDDSDKPDIPDNKIKAQRRETLKQLRSLIEQRDAMH